jgi:acyl-CoA synthetase (AMP-forming)/AMP-acid ligase II
MWVPHVVVRNRRVRPDAVAVADADGRVTWSELDARTDALATALADRGVRAGDRVMVLSRNRVEVVELYVAVAKAGAIVCPVNHGFPAPEVTYVVGNLEPTCVFAEPDVLDRLGDALGTGWRVAVGSEEYERMAATPPRPWPMPAQDQVFAILQTSATTGRPKGVTVTHRSIMACYTGMAAEMRMSEADVMLNPCPFFHGSMVIGLALLAAGGTLVFQREFTPQGFLADVERFRVTIAFLVPSMVRFAMRAKAFDTADLSSLREVMYGGAPMTEELLREALRRFPCGFRNVYGITEGGGPIALLAPEELRPDGDEQEQARLLSAGRMMPGAHIVVLDDDGRPVPPGELGEVCVRGDGMMTGYWRNPEATAQAIRDGYLRTGDLGYADSDGYLFLLDRRSDLILRGGQNVYPAEIERVLRAEPGVADVAVVGRPSEEWGEVPVAFVVADGDPPNPRDLLAACTRELASYKRPAEIRFVDEIPRNPAGKILRKVLRTQVGRPAAAPSRQD